MVGTESRLLSTVIQSFLFDDAKLERILARDESNDANFRADTGTRRNSEVHGQMVGSTLGPRNFG